MVQNRKDQLKELIEKVLDNKDKNQADYYQKSLEQLIEDLKIYQIELEFQNEELKRIQEELEGSRQEFLELFEAAPVGYVITDENYNIIKYNSFFVTQIIKNLKTDGSSDIRKFIAPRDQDKFHFFCRELIRQSLSLETELQLNPCSPVFVKVTANSTVKSGKTFFRFAFTDITKRVIAEQKLLLQQQEISAISENMSEVVIVSDMDGIISFVSPSFVRWGFERDQFVGESIFSLVHHNDIEDVMLAFQKGISTKDSSLVRFRILKSNKEALWVETSGRFIYNEDGEAFKTLFVVRDISHIIENEKLEQEIAVKKQTLQFKQKFLASLSHEIRTPLTGVIGMVEMLEKTGLDNIQKDFVHTLKNSSENLREIIDQVLDYSKIELGKVKLKKITFHPGDLMNEAKQLFSVVCDKDISFSSTIDPLLPPLIYADKKRLTQVVNNLLVNAIKFSEKGSISIEILKESYLSAEETLIKVLVKDTGIGIESGLQEQIFTPFSQIGKIDSEKYHGIGLGLTICKELVELHGGEMGVSSEPGKGSTFWFTFLAQVKNDETTPVTTKGEWKLSAKNPGKLRIFLVEDKVVTQKVVKLQLTSLGHRVKIVSNGQEALDAYEHGEYDLILMDIQMPVMDGITATRLLRMKYSNMPPVVGLSANAFEGDREKYLDQGLDEYLTKPVSSADFQNLVDKLFR